MLLVYIHSYINLEYSCLRGNYDEIVKGYLTIYDKLHNQNILAWEIIANKYYLALAIYY